MKLAIPQRDLAGLLYFAAKTVERRNTIPILANVLLRASDNQLSIKATDLDIQVEQSIACEVAKSGETTVPAHLLEQIVKKIKPADATITLEFDDKGILSIKAARSRFTLQTLPTSDFPDLATFGAGTGNEEAHSFEIPAANIKLLIERSQFCISTEETRYYLNGIYLHHHKGPKVTTLRGCATDGHRLAQVECDAPDGSHTFGGGNNPNGVILPRKTVDLMLSVLGDGGFDTVGVRITTSRIVLEMGDMTLTSKLIDGSFPDYQRVVPQGNDKILRAGRQELFDAVDRLSIVSGERSRATKFALTSGKLTISLNNPDAGAASEDMDVEYTGDDLEIGFNARYMTDILKNVQGEQVEIRLADPGSPALIVGVGQPESLFVAMPLRV